MKTLKDFGFTTRTISSKEPVADDWYTSMQHRIDKLDNRIDEVIEINALLRNEK